MIYVCVCVFSSFVQPNSCGPQSCRHSVCEDRVIHRHERGGPSLHISKLSVLFCSMLDMEEDINIVMGIDIVKFNSCHGKHETVQNKGLRTCLRYLPHLR